jgi:rod shape-determining protein MreB
MASSVAIDLGTVNTLVYAPRRGIVVDEPSVVALERSTQKAVAVGRGAEALCDRAPMHLKVVRPLRDGVISDLDACAAMLKAFLRRLYPHYRLDRPTALVCVPSGATEVEMRALVEASESGNPHLRVTLVDEAFAAALGAGLDRLGSSAMLVIDIGGGTSEMAVVASSGPVLSRSIRVAGNAMDEAIVQAVRNEYGLLIGRKTAEQLKMAVGINPRGDKVEVTGVDVRRLGWLRTEEIAPKLIAGALERPVNAILTAFNDLLGEVPADIAAELVGGGIRLAGGGALLPGLADRVSERSHCRAEVVADPLRCVVRGVASLLEPGSQPRYAA